jgi:IclR helix-turn-helix domain
MSGEPSIGSGSPGDGLVPPPQPGAGPQVPGEDAPAAHRGELSKSSFSGQDAGQARGEGQVNHKKSHVSRDERSTDQQVSITLSRNQIDHIVRAALGDGAAPSVSALVAGTGFHQSHARQVLGARYRALQDNRRLSRSLLAGLLVLSCFPPEGIDMGIKDISEQLELNTSTVHRYVLTLVAAGLLERDPETRRYRLLPE